MEDMVRKADLVKQADDEERKELAERVKLLLNSVLLTKDLSESKPEDVLILALDLMRYGDQRCAWGPWWFLAFTDCDSCREYQKEDESSYCEDCTFNDAPDIEKYEWNEAGVEQFVIDRAKWAHPKMNADLPDFYKALRELPQEQLIRRTLNLRFWRN